MNWLQVAPYAFTEQGVAMLSTVLSSLLFPLPLRERGRVRGNKDNPLFLLKKAKMWYKIA
jgi:hypothetical protein